MEPRRVLVVEDSLTVRKKIVGALESDPALRVVGEAADGHRAIELVQSLRPDVITLDIVLPVMDGLATTEYIMAHFPTPILIVSSSFERRDVFRTYDTLAAGAVDVLEKPKGIEEDEGWEDALRAAVKIVSRIRVITHPGGKHKRQPLGVEPRATPSPAHPVAPRLVAIGASTGGPLAVSEVLEAVAGRIDVPILFVIHIGEAFGRTLADWLQSRVPFPVRMAQDGEALPPRGTLCALMGPPGRHLTVRNGHIHLLDGPPHHSCRPSVDTLFESVAREVGPAALGVLLTGMGRDGATGMLAMARAEACTIAQDEASSVIFGMPREAIALGAAGLVLPLGRVGPAVVAWATGRGTP